MMRAAALLALVFLPATHTAAQASADDPPDTLLAPDSTRIRLPVGAPVAPVMIEEQVPTPEDGEEAVRELLPADERDPGIPARAGSRRRADRWRASLTVRSGAVLQKGSAYSRGSYAGDRVKLFQRVAVRGGGWFSAEALTDKDPGESSAADFVSASASVSLFDGGVRLVAGDYRVRTGQGLLYGSARPVGKGAAVIEPAMRDSWGIPDGVSSDEARFFRGGAIEARAGPLRVLAFGSRRAVTPLLSGEGELRGLDVSGYHRTASEITRRGALTDRSAGGAVRLSFGDLLSVGVAILATSYRKSDASGSPPGPGPQSTDPEPSAQSIVSVRRLSIDLRARAGGVTVFGEGLPSGSRTAWIAGALFGGPACRMVIVRRSYPPAGVLGGTSGFADAPGGSNERGTYAGAEALIVQGVSVSAFLDLYSRILPIAGSVHPPAGVDRLVSLRYEPARSFSAELRYRSTDAEAGTPDAGSGPLPVPGNIARSVQRARAEVRWLPAPETGSMVRLDHCAAFPGDGGRESGAMLTAGFTVEAWGAVTFDARMRFFRTDSYDSGIPAVDAELPGTVSSTVYSGEGSAWSAGWSWNWRWRGSAHARLSFRYSVLRRDDLRRIGTGPAELPSNLREKAGIALDIAF